MPNSAAGKGEEATRHTEVRRNRRITSPSGNGHTLSPLNPATSSLLANNLPAYFAIAPRMQNPREMKRPGRITARGGKVGENGASAVRAHRQAVQALLGQLHE